MKSSSIPVSILLLGSPLYMDNMQKNYLERLYPYLRYAPAVFRFPAHNTEHFNLLLNFLASLEGDLHCFATPSNFEELRIALKETGHFAVNKEEKLYYRIHGTVFVLAKVPLFEKLSAIYTKNGYPNSAIHLFGNEEKLNTLRKYIQNETSITPLLPEWWRIENINQPLFDELIKKAGSLGVNIIPNFSVIASLIEYLSTIGKTVTFAESCTGGLLASRFTSCSGASDILKGSFVSYSNEIKKAWLGVREDTLLKHGAVSKECVLEMAAGAAKKAGSDIAISISGIAGPTGAVEGKPVGTVYISVLNGKSQSVERVQLKGDRNKIQEQAVRHAILMLIYSEKKIFTFFQKTLDI